MVTTDTLTSNLILSKFYVLNSCHLTVRGYITLPIYLNYILIFSLRNNNVNHIIVMISLINESIKKCNNVNCARCFSYNKKTHHYTERVYYQRILTIPI